MCLPVGLSNSLCSNVNSLNHGQLSLAKSGKFRPNCVSDLFFKKSGNETKVLCKKSKVSENKTTP